MAEKSPSYHGPLPMRALIDDRLSGLELRALALYAFHDRLSLTRGSGQGCFASNRTLSIRLRCDYTSLSKVRTSLEKKGYIRLEARAGAKRLEVVRVIPDHLADRPNPRIARTGMDDCEPWPFDQGYIGPRTIEAWNSEPLEIGELTNDAAPKVGEFTNSAEPIVGREISETRRNLPKTEAQYIPLKGEDTSLKGGENIQDEPARFGQSADRQFFQNENTTFAKFAERSGVGAGPGTADGDPVDRRLLRTLINDAVAAVGSATELAHRTGQSATAISLARNGRRISNATALELRSRVLAVLAPEQPARSSIWAHLRPEVFDAGEHAWLPQLERAMKLVDLDALPSDEVVMITDRLQEVREVYERETLGEFARRLQDQFPRVEGDENGLACA